MTTSSSGARHLLVGSLLLAATVLMGAGALTAFDDFRLGIGAFLAGVLCLGLSAAVTLADENGGASA